MSSGPSVFKKTDVARACRAVIAAGLQVTRVEISKTGVITIVPGKPEGTTTANNPWDDVLDAENEKRIA
jgi:hypothetical protein